MNSTFEPRIRFNWGYHDAAQDVLELKIYRNLVEKGQQSPQTVSKEFDPYYYEGYKLGSRDANSGAYIWKQTNSEAAWKEYQSR